MPLTSKGEKIMGNMQKEYGEKEGKKVFYASRNAGTIKGVDVVPANAVANSGIPATNKSRSFDWPGRKV